MMEVVVVGSKRIVELNKENVRIINIKFVTNNVRLHACFILPIPHQWRI